MNSRNAESLALAFIIAMFALAGLTWPSAPTQIPIHWDISGQIDAYGSKFTGLLLMPLVALAGYTLIGLAPILKPEQFDEPATNALAWFRLTYVLVMAGVFGVIVGDIRGASLNMNYVILPALGLTLVAVANLLVHLKRTRTSKPGDGIQI